MPRAQSAISVDPSGDDRRYGSERVSVNAPSTVRAAAAAPREVLVEDLSSTGFRFRSSDRFVIGARVHLGLAGAGMAQARIVRATDGVFGCEFAAPLTDDQLRLAFSGGTVLAPDFGGRQTTATLLPYRDERYPGAARLVVLAGGTVLCWAAVAFAGARALALLAG